MRLATAFLLLAVGLIAGYILGRETHAPARSARPDASAAPEAPSPHAPDRTDTARASPTIAAALEALPPPEIEKGSGTITGSVLAADGSPLEGVVIRASARWPVDMQGPTLTRGEPPPEASLEQLVLERVEPLRRALASRVRASTDAEGRYVLSDLADVEYWVMAYREGFSLEPFGGRVRPGATLDFRASPLVDVPVVVLAPDGTEAASATVHVMYENNSYSSEAAWSPQAPDLPLKQGRCTLWATQGEQYDSAMVRTTVAGDAPPAPVTIRLKERAAIRGRVIVPPDETPWSIEVFMLRVQPGSRPDENVLLSAGTSRTAMAQNGYSFAAIQLQPGTYAVGAGWVRGRIDAMETVDVAGGTADVEIHLPRPDPTQHVLVHVRDANGQAVDVASVRTSAPGMAGGLSIRRRDGSYWVAHPSSRGQRDAPAAAPCMIHVQVEELGEKSVSYKPEPGAEVTIRFEAAARLGVMVEGLAGPELQGCLELRLVRDDGTWLEAKTPDVDGRAAFLLQPGSYELRLLSKRSGYQRALASATALRVVPGENTVTIPLPALHTLTVLTSAKQVRLAPAETTAGFYGEEQPAENGKALFERLPAGRYRVRGSGQPVEVEVPAQLTVRVD